MHREIRILIIGFVKFRGNQFKTQGILKNSYSRFEIDFKRNNEFLNLTLSCELRQKLSILDL